MKNAPPLCFLDTETTGHDPLMPVEIAGEVLLQPWHEITEIGCVFTENPGLEPIGTFYTHVKPKHPERCDPKTVPITNFPERWAKGEWDGAPSLEEAIRLLFQECRRYGGENAVVIPGGQNWFFDWNFLSVSFALLGIPDEEHTKYLSYKRFDTASMAIQELWDPREPLDMSDYSLRGGKLQQALGIEPEPKPHTALNGAWQSYLVFRKLTERKLIRLVNGEPTIPMAHAFGIALSQKRKEDLAS